MQFIAYRYCRYFITFIVLYQNGQGHELSLKINRLMAEQEKNEEKLKKRKEEIYLVSTTLETKMEESKVLARLEAKIAELEVDKNEQKIQEQARLEAEIAELEEEMKLRDEEIVDMKQRTVGQTNPSNTISSRTKRIKELEKGNGSLEHHLRDPQYANWVKNGLALRIANETIKPHVVKELGKFHNSLVTKCSGVSTLKDEIKKSHQHSNPSFYISDDRRWGTDPWEVGKCYMPPMRRYGSCTPADADFSAVVNIIINNRHFEQLVTCDLSISGNIFCQGRDMRNKIMHSNDLRVYDTDFNHNVDLLIAILEAFNPVLTGLTEAVDKIQKLKTDKLTLSLGDVLDVREEALHAIKEEVERGKSEMGSQVEMGRLTIKEYVEEEKPKIKVEVGRQIERLREEINSSVTISEEQRLRTNFVDGCRHALLDILRYQMEMSRPKHSKTLTLQEFLGRIEFSQEIGRFSERHREFLYPFMGEPKSADTWDMFLLCQVPLIETRWNLPNNVILFIKDLKTTRDKLLEKPGSVGLGDLLALCDDYLDDPLKQSTKDIFNRNTTEADTVLVHSVLESWKRNEDDFETQRVSEKYLNENKKMAKVFEFLWNQFEEQQRHMEEQRQDSDGRLKRLETLLMVQSTDEGVGMGARPKELKTRVELKAKNCYKADCHKIESNITSENNNIAMKNGSITRFNEEMEIDDTKPKQGSMIFEVTCGSITELIAFWDKCMDGRAVKALSGVRDTYREFTNCKELEFDVILTKKEVERCMNQIVDDLHNYVYVMGSASKPDQPTIIKKADVLVKNAEELDKSFEPALVAGKETNGTLEETFQPYELKMENKPTRDFENGKGIGLDHELKRVNDMAENYDRWLKRLKSEKDDLEGKLNEKKQEVKRLEEDLAKLRSDADNHEQLILEKNKPITDLNEEITHLKGRLILKDEEIAALKKTPTPSAIKLGPAPKSSKEKWFEKEEIRNELLMAAEERKRVHKDLRKQMGNTWTNGCGEKK